MAIDFKSFLGTGWSFPPQFYKETAQVAMISDEEDIESSLEILLSTTVGERIMQPEYGCNMNKLVFEPISLSLEAYIKDLIFTAVYYFEPRVLPNEVKLVDATLEGIIYVNLGFTIRTTNTRHNLVYPFYLTEGTNLLP
jgi:uncharacterized protein